MNRAFESQVARGRIASRSRVKVAAGMVAVGTLIGLSACSSTPEPTPSAPAGEVSGSLTYWYGLDSTDPESVATWEQWNIQPFKDAYPYVQVKAIPNAGIGLAAKVKTALAAGQGPDFIETPGSSTAIPYAAAGYLESLDALAQEEGWADTILPWALDMGYIDGKLQAMPTSYETLVLYYNKTLFDEHGWVPPTDRTSLEDLAGEMQTEGIIPFANGNASYPGATEWLVSAFLNEVAGPAKIHAALTGEIPWTDPAIIDAIQLLNQYFDEGYFAGGTKQYFSLQDPQKYAKFANGDAAMYISGSWEMGDLPSYFGADGNKSEWAWAPLPPLADGVPSDVYPLSVGGTISVNSASKSIPAANAYLRWLFSDTKHMWAAAAANGTLPLPIRFEPSDIPSDIDPRYAAQYQAISDASFTGNVGYVTWTSLGGKAESYILDNMDKVINNDLSPEDFCTGLDDAFGQDEAAGLVPSVFDTKAGS